MDNGFTNDAIPALSVCESPIEGRFIQAWFNTMKAIGTTVEYLDGETFKLGVEFKKTASDGCFFLGIQGRIHCLNGGRVDLVVGYIEESFRTSFVVELDGREFHASADRQQKDKSRDRELFFYGLPVIRYTGSEVYADADGIATKLIRAILTKNEDQRVESLVAFEAGFIAGDRVPDHRTADEFEELKISSWKKFISGGV